jgi:H+/Cl- antiporter ClcA
VAIVLYAAHGGTHLLRWLGVYYGGETRIPTRPPRAELRAALPLLVALAAMLLLYPQRAGPSARAHGTPPGFASVPGKP